MYMPGWNHESLQLWNGTVPMPTHIFLQWAQKGIPEGFVLSGCVLLKHPNSRWAQKQDLCRAGPEDRQAMLLWAALGGGSAGALPSHPTSLRTHRKLQGGQERFLHFDSWAAAMTNTHGWMSRQGPDDGCIFSSLAWQSLLQAVGQLWRSRSYSCCPGHGRS